VIGNSRTPLRVVALSENNPYPRDVRVRPHMEALADAGYQVALICPHAQGQLWNETINGVRVYRFPTLPAGLHAAGYILEFFWATLVMTVLTLWVWIRHGMDVLHIYNPPESLFVAGLLPKLAGKIIVCDLREISPELYLSKYEKGSGITYSLLILMERIFCWLADYIIVVNESCRRLILERNRVVPGQVFIVRQGPDLNQVGPTDPDPSLRSRAGTIIAFLGAMAKQDGIEHLLGALHDLDQHFGHKDWLCVLVGPGIDQQSLETLAAKLGISDRTWFPGYLPIEQWLPILSSADICVEPCPMSPLNNLATMQKIMDYMALGKPTVAYDLPEHRFTAGEAALYAKPDNQVDLARQIARLIDDFDLRTQLGSMGRQRIEQQFAWQYQKAHLLAVYANLKP
jgi:glycosyltransferase involved in cell wall biosynthesis